MLNAKAEITFTLEGRNYSSGKYPLRPTFRFGDGLLFSGNIKSDVTEYLYNNKYLVDIEFFTIEDDGYSAIKPYLNTGMDLVIQEGSKIIGLAILNSFVYMGKQ
jgi:hypothetical protein